MQGWLDELGHRTLIEGHQLDQLIPLDATELALAPHLVPHAQRQQPWTGNLGVGQRQDINQQRLPVLSAIGELAKCERGVGDFAADQLFQLAHSAAILPLAPPLTA